MAYANEESYRKYIERKKRWRQENPEKYKEQRKGSDDKYRKSHKNREVMRRFYLRNRERLIEYAKQHRSHNVYPGVYFQKRYELFSRIKWCENCGCVDKLRTHHIISSGKENKTHEIWNLMVLCEKCHIKVHTAFGKKEEYLKNVILSMVGKG